MPFRYARTGVCLTTAAPQLQGTWQCVALRDGGRSSTPEDLTWTFQGNEVIVQAGGQTLRGTYKLSRFLVVHRFIDVTVPQTPGGEPTTFYGSYAFTEGGLSVCYNSSAELRPKTVRPNADNGDVRYDFRRKQ